MKKLIIVLITTAVIVGGLLSCDLLGIVPDIPSSSLEDADYGNLPADETEATALMIAALAGAGYDVGVGLSGKVALAIDSGIDERALTAKMLEPFVPAFKTLELPEARTVTANGYTDDYSGRFNINITNETVAGSAGTADINSFVVKAEGSSDETYTQFDGEASVNGAIEFTNFVPKDGSSVKITDGKLDILGNGTASYTESDSSVTISYDIKLTIKAGLSISNPAAGGKLIFSFTYNDKQDNLDVSNLSTLAEDLTSEVTMKATLEVYDNDDVLHNTYTWDQNDIYEVFAEQADAFDF